MADGFDLILTARWQADQEPAFVSLLTETDQLMVRAGAGQLAAKGEEST